MIRVQFHHDARSELLCAARWYEKRRANLGTELRVEVERAVTAIASRPDTWPRFMPARPEMHRFLLPRFPFAILYALRDDHVLVVALAHTSRKPGYWLDRLAPSRRRARGHGPH